MMMRTFEEFCVSIVFSRVPSPHREDRVSSSQAQDMRCEQILLPTRGPKCSCMSHYHILIHSFSSTFSASRQLPTHLTLVATACKSLSASFTAPPCPSSLFLPAHSTKKM